jgi:hypothetical protein
VCVCVCERERERDLAVQKKERKKVENCFWYKQIHIVSLPATVLIVRHVLIEN